MRVCRGVRYLLGARAVEEAVARPDADDGAHGHVGVHDGGPCVCSQPDEASLGYAAKIALIAVCTRGASWRGCRGRVKGRWCSRLYARVCVCICVCARARACARVRARVGQARFQPLPPAPFPRAGVPSSGSKATENPEPEPPHGISFGFSSDAATWTSLRTAHQRAEARACGERQCKQGSSGGGERGKGRQRVDERGREESSAKAARARGE